jgi:Ca2+-binding RTX toxin-like protein
MTYGQFKLTLAIVALLSFSMVGVGPAQAQPTCGDPPQTATVIPSGPGTEGDDELEGTTGKDVIIGLAGDDKIKGLGEDDIICGGSGVDEIHGGDDNDKIFGDSGDDDIVGGDGDDELFGGSGDDAMKGGDGKDTFDGGSGTDTCVTDGTDVLVPGTNPLDC